MLRCGGGRRVRERDRIATGVDTQDVAGVGVEEEAWDGRALRRRIQELQQGGAIKLFMDGLYLPSAEVPHGGCMMGGGTTSRPPASHWPGCLKQQ